MFELSIRWGWRKDNPAKGVERYTEEARPLAFPGRDYTRLTAALDAHQNQNAANAIRLQLLTGARIGEVLTSKWEDFDLERGVWAKPSHHTKQKNTEHLPLSKSAVALLADLAARADPSQPFVFPGRVPGQPIKELKAFWKSIIECTALPGYRIHDNRHTHASHWSQAGSVSRSLVASWGTPTHQQHNATRTLRTTLCGRPPK